MKDKELACQGLILVDSPKVVRRMMEEGVEPLEILDSEDFLESHRELLSQYPKCEVFVGERPVLEEIVGHKLHHGVIARAKRPPSLNLQDLGSKILVLDGLNKAENVGTIIRSCDSFGIDSILLGKKSLSPYVRRAIRVSMGSVFRVKVRIAEDLVNDLNSLKGSGFSIYGTGNDVGAISIQNLEFPKKTALIIGSEGFGMSQGVREVLDQTIRIPIRDSVDSLNASVAASICLYELGKT